MLSVRVRYFTSPSSDHRYCIYCSGNKSKKYAVAVLETVQIMYFMLQGESYRKLYILWALCCRSTHFVMSHTTWFPCVSRDQWRLHSVSMAPRETYTREETTDNGSGSAQGAILIVLGIMLVIPGIFLAIYGAHHVHEVGAPHHIMAVVLGPILLLIGVALLLFGLTRCGAIKCIKKDTDQLPVVEHEHIPEHEDLEVAVEVACTTPSGVLAVNLQPVTEYNKDKKY